MTPSNVYARKKKAKMLGMFFAHVLSYDVWFYMSHIALHTPSLFWIHKRHHENQFPTWVDTYHESGLEGMIQSVGFVVPWLVENPDMWASIAAFAFLNVRGMLQHDKRGVWVVGDHHLQHHEKLKGNYGQPWLDRLFGTSIQSNRRQSE